MKTAKLVVTISACVLMIVSVVFVTVTNRRSHSVKESSLVCKELTRDCELLKKFTAIKIIKIADNRTCLDAFGNMIIIGNWYVMVNSTNVLLPIKHKNYDNFGRVGVDELNLLSFPLSLKNSKKIKIDDMVVGEEPFLRRIIHAEVEMLLTGENEIKIDKNQTSQELLFETH